MAMTSVSLRATYRQSNVSWKRHKEEVTEWHTESAHSLGINLAMRIT